jgi:hypothetical protein
MRKAFVVIACALLAVGLASGTAMAQGSDRHILISGSVGGFVPSADYDEKLNIFDAYTWSGGPDVTFEIAALVSQYLGIEFGMHVYTAETDEVAGTKMEVGVFGMETLVIFQNREADIQPFGGIGFGFYSNHYAFKVNDNVIYEDDGGGAGVVLKGGVRGFITDSFFLQGFVKAFSNIQEYQDKDGNVVDRVNYGGSSFNVGLGVAF